MNIYRFKEIYRCMNRRCTENNRKDNKRYKNKWIRVEWTCFEDFYSDMRESYVEHSNKYWELNTSIDRINSDLNYSKDNCRWVTMKEQHSNIRRNISEYIYKWNIVSQSELWRITWIPATRLRRLKNKFWNNYDNRMVLNFRNRDYFRKELP